MRYLPFNMPAHEITDSMVREAAHKLNNMPRAILGFKTPKEVHDKLDYENVSWPFATFTPTGGITAVLATDQDEILIGFSNGKLFKFTLDSKCPSTFCVKKIDFIAHLKGITDLVGSTNNTVYSGAFDGIYRIEEKQKL